MPIEEANRPTVSLRTVPEFFTQPFQSLEGTNADAEHATMRLLIFVLASLYVIVVLQWACPNIRINVLDFCYVLLTIEVAFRVGFVSKGHKTSQNSSADPSKNSRKAA